MQNLDSQIIVKRFFEALYALKAQKIIRGKKNFTDKYEINRWNFLTLERNHASGMFQTAWLGYLVKEFGVSSEWLLTGDGDMLVK